MSKLAPKETNVVALPLEQRIRQWIQSNPDRAEAGERMLVQLHRIRQEFTGDTALRLEGLVEETLSRQLRIDESRRAGLEAAKVLSETVKRLTESMSQCLLTAKKAHVAAIGAAANAMQARSQMAVAGPTGSSSSLKSISLGRISVAPNKKLMN